MRSEERAGIILIVMLFFWGTLIAEPFHIFSRYIAETVTSLIGKTGAGDIIISLVLYLAVIGVIVLMQKLSRTRFDIYMPCAISTISILVLVVRSIVSHSINYFDVVCLAVPAITGIVFYLIKFEKGLEWYTDIYIYSLAIALLNSLLFVPLSKLNGFVDKILYITNYNDLNITGSFKDLAGIPELVWGMFFTAFAVFPIIYLATSSRRK